MIRLNLKQIHQKLVTVTLALVMLQTPLVVWLWSHWPNQALIFKSVADVVIVASFLIGLYLLIKNWAQLQKYRLWWGLIGGYVLLTVLASLPTLGQWRSLLAGLVIDLRYILILVSGLVASALDKTWADKITKFVFKLSLMVGIFALLQVTVLPRDFLRNFGYSATTIQPYLVIDQNEAYVRINSTLRGPNPLGALAVIVLALALSRFYSSGQFKRSNAINLILIFLAGLALLNSHSRSAWLAGGIVGLACLIYYFKSARQLVKWSVLVGCGLLVLGLVVLIIKDDNHNLTDEFQHLFLHDNTEVSHVSSDTEHQSSVVTALNLIKNRPIFGHGVGSAGSASLMRQDGQAIIIENQFLFIWYETGLVGLTMFVGLYGLVLWHLFKMRQDWAAFGLLVSGVGLAVIGLLLPVFVDSVVAVTWWSLSGAIIGKTSYNRK